MDEQELRELDARVHKALYPDGMTFKFVDISHGSVFADNFVMDESGAPVPHYTTDLAVWDAVYALKPEWSWEHIESSGLITNLYGTRPITRPIRSVVSATEATGLAAYALGRARCVLAWAEAQR